MANLQSQKKRIRQDERRHKRNQAHRTRARGRVKEFQQAVADGDEEAAREAFRAASSALDRAASKGVIHDNKAARKKSRMARDLRTVTG